MTKPIKFMRIFMLTGFLLSLMSNINAQSPFLGMYIEEIPIPQIYPDIEAQTPGAKIYRVYVCLSEPFWELQAVFGYNVYPLDLVPQDGATFYQNSFGGPTSQQINAAFFPVVPSMQYDSFITIGRLSSTNNDLQIITDPTLPFYWYDNFENSGGGMLFNDVVGTSFVIAVNRSLPIPMGGYTDQNVPDANMRILVGQFTTNGIFTGNMNFQFRKLNPDYSTYLPIQSLQVIGASINNTPGIMDEPCIFMSLPVDMINFEAYLEMNHVSLRWVTETEINNDYFIIERSKDGINFEEIGNVDGAGTSTNRHIYHIIDPNPIEGVNYYRLRQTDFNGIYKYTEIVTIYFESNNSQITIYPNPSMGEEVFIDGHTENLKRYIMYSSEGKLLINRETYGESLYSIKMQHLALPPGMYYFKFITKTNQTLHKKLVIR